MNTPVPNSSVVDGGVLGGWASTLSAIAVALLALGWLYSGTITEMVKVWRTSESYGHGFLIAPVAIWLVWRQRAALVMKRPVVNILGAVLLALCCAAWVVFEISGINALTQFAVVAMISAVVLTFAGWRITRSLWFPLLFLFFMVPAGEALIPMLMDGTANATIWALRISGIPVYREGLHFMLPTGHWSVVEACSGLRYIIAALVLAMLFAHLNFTSLKRQAAFILAALMVAIVANWMRAYLIVLVGHFSQMRLGVGDDHVIYGWVFFGAVMFAVFWMGSHWQQPASALIRPVASAIDAPPPRALARPLATAAMLGLVLLIGAGSRQALAVARNVTMEQPLANITRELGNEPIEKLAVRPHFDKARAHVSGTLEPASSTQFYVAYFARQWEGAEMISHGHAVVPPDDRQWRIVERRRLAVRDAVGKTRPVEELKLRAGNQQRLLWYWYTIGDMQTVGDYSAKALTAWSMLRGLGDHSTVTVLMTDPEIDPVNAAQRLQAAAISLTNVAMPIVENQGSPKL